VKEEPVLKELQLEKFDVAAVAFVVSYLTLA
jgi:hypothetical protein